MGHGADVAQNAVPVWDSPFADSHVLVAVLRGILAVPQDESSEHDVV